MVKYCYSENDKLDVGTIYMGKPPVISRYGLMEIKLRTGEFRSRITFSKSHLPRNASKMLMLVSKMCEKKWGTNFPVKNSGRKTGLTFQTFRCSRKFSS